MRVRIAWALAVFSGLCAVADTVLSARHGSLLSHDVLVTHDGRLVLLDFGLVMEARRAHEEAASNLVVGTERYMAPEQAAGVLVGPQADCYSIGVVLYTIVLLSTL